jgi:hypothetical protein
MDNKAVLGRSCVVAVIVASAILGASAHAISRVDRPDRQTQNGWA